MISPIWPRGSSLPASSMIRMSLPRPGVPTDSALRRTSSGRRIVLIPSVNPYSSKRTGAISAMTRRFSSARSVEPTDDSNRSELKSVVGRSTWPRTA